MRLRNPSNDPTHDMLRAVFVVGQYEKTVVHEKGRELLLGTLLTCVLFHLGTLFRQWVELISALNCGRSGTKLHCVCVFGAIKMNITMDE